jgi:hypothetical protein
MSTPKIMLLKSKLMAMVRGLKAPSTQGTCYMCCTPFNAKCVVKKVLIQLIVSELHPAMQVRVDFQPCYGPLEKVKGKT